MKIENEKFKFHPKCQFSQLKLDPLQEQYLAHLRMGHSIQELVSHYYQKGWLVDFQKLYEMVALFAQYHWILNENIVQYFQNLQLKVSTAVKPVSTVNKEKTSYDLKTLLQLPFFRSLNEKLSTYLLKTATAYVYPAESMICKTGDSSRDMFVLLSGQAAIYKQMGHYRQFISLLSESSVFGEIGFLLGEKRSADIITVKKSDILIIPYTAEVLDQFLNKEKAQELQKRFWVQHALLNSDFFKNFPTDCLDALTFSGKLIELNDQQILFHEGDIGPTAYIVIQGSLEVIKGGKTISILQQGSFFGEMALMVNGGKRSAAVKSQRKSLVMEIHMEQFYQLLGQNLYLAKEIQALAVSRNLSNRNQEMSR